jgi:hypothetical protein
MANARQCPQCGSAVTPFAAGCAVCGADLEAHRAREAQRGARLERVRPPALPRPRVSPDVMAVGLTLLAAVFMPLLALVMAVLWARDPMRANVRHLLIGCGILAAVLLLVPSLRYGLLFLLYR